MREMMLSYEVKESEDPAFLEGRRQMFMLTVKSLEFLENSTPK